MLRELELLEREIPHHVTGVSSAAMEILCKKDWPGNIRELANELAPAIIRCKESSDDEREPWHLSALSVPTISVEQAESASEESGGESSKPKWNRLQVAERDELVAVLSETGSQAATARVLGLARQQVHQLVKKYGIRGRSPFR